MLRNRFTLILPNLGFALALTTTSASGNITLSINDVTFAPQPNGSSEALGHGVTAWTFDVLADVTPTSDDWAVSEITAETLAAGVRFHWVADAHGRPILTAPGLADDFHRFATFVNFPRAQFSNERFISPAGVAGYGECQFATLNDDGLCALMLEFPPTAETPDFGAIARITIDTSGSAFACARVIAATEPPQNSTEIAHVTVQAGTVNRPAPIETLSFGLYALNQYCALAGCEPGDVDKDCDVDLDDLARALAHYGAANARCNDGDVNNDGAVDLVDVGEIISRYGATCQ